MKILYNIRTSNFDDGGTIAWKNMLENLLRYNDFFPYVALRGKGEISDWLEKKNVPYYFVGFQDIWAYNLSGRLSSVIKQIIYFPYKILSNLIVIYRLKRIIVNVNPDIIHSNTVWVASGYFAGIKTGTKHLWHLREYGDIFGNVFLPSNFLYRNKMLKNSFTVSITPDVASHFQCVNSHKDFVVIDGVVSPNSIRYSEFKENYFLSVGAGSPVKGSDLIIDAYIKYANANNNTLLYLVGYYNNKYKDKITKKLHDAGVGERVKFLGFRKDRYNLMYHAKASIVASPYEGFGLVAVESIVNGCLLIGRNTTGTKYIMEQIPDCFYSFETTDQLADILNTVSSNLSSKYKKQILRAQRIISDKFSFDQCGSAMYQVYTKILNS